MTAREVYQKNLNVVHDFVDEESGMLCPYFVGVYNGWVFDAENRLRKLTEEEFVKENENLSFEQDSFYEENFVNNTVEDFASCWCLSVGERSLLKSIEK